MADFHRLVTPTYFGGLPAGYDYLNTPSDASVGGTGIPALVDGLKAGGTNDGTYFVAFKEDGLSKAVNRGLAAVGLNTDFLDNILRTSIPKIAIFEATASGAVSTVNLTGEIFVGESGMINNATNRNLLVHITEQADNNDLEVSGTKITSSLIHDGASANVVGTQASGFRTNVSVNFSPPIPNGTQYRVWYGVRSSLAEIALTEKGAYFKHQIRIVEHINGTLRSLLRQLHSETAVNQAYNAAFDSTIRSLASAGLNERYRRSTTQPVGFLTADYNVAGGGRVIVRDGGAVEVRSASVDITTAQYPDPQLAGIRTTTNVTARTLTGFGATKGGDIGFLHESETIKESSAVEAVRDSYSGPGFVDVTPRDIRAATTGAATVLTFINPTAAASLNPDSVNNDTNRRTIQCAAGQYFRIGGQSSMRPNIDLVEVTYGGRAPETYVFASCPSDTRILVNRLNGTQNSVFPAAATSCTIRYLQVLFFAGGSPRAGLTGPNVWGDSKFYVAQPAQLTDNPLLENWPRAPGFYAALNTAGIDDNGYTAMAWGNVATENLGDPAQLGFLRGDGSIDTPVIRSPTVTAGSVTATSVAVVGSLTTTVDIVAGDDLVATDDLIVGDDATIGGDLTLTGQVLGSLAVAVSITAGSDIVAADDLQCGDDLFVGDKAVIQGHLAVNNPVFFYTFNEDFIRFTQIFTPNLLHTTDHTWIFNEIAGTFTLLNAAPSAKNPGQLQIIGAGGGVSRKLAIYPTSQFPFAFDNIEFLEVTLSVNDNATNAYSSISVGFFDATVGGGTDILAVTYVHLVGWALLHQRAGAVGAHNFAVLGPKVNDAFVVVRFIKNGADIDVIFNGVPALTVLAAEIPTGNGTLLIYVEQTIGDVNPATWTVDDVAFRVSSALDRTGL